MPAIPPTLAALLLAASTASAAITIDTVWVADAGSGRVAYNYQIGTYEVTNSEYTAFLNAVASTDKHSLYKDLMDTSPHGGISRSGSPGNYSYSVKDGFENKPVNFVSFWDAARFANWLTNGQPTGPQGNGTTKFGAYTLISSLISNNNVTRGNWYSESMGNTSSETVFAVASADEWHKAAYYGGDDNYYAYPAAETSRPTAVAPESAAGSNNANYNNVVGSVTEVGAYSNSDSHYGTFDQGGNVFEWTEAIVGSSYRGMRGGSFDFSGSTLHSSYQLPLHPNSYDKDIGFRVTRFAPTDSDPHLSSISGFGGTVSPTGSSNYPVGTEVTITATPYAGYLFDSWSGSVSGTDPQITVTLDQDHYIKANFVQDQRDPDSDGLTNYEEATIGSDPNVADTSGDGLSDGVVANAGFDPTTPLSSEDFTTLISSGQLAVDSNKNGLTDSFENAPNPATLNNLGYYTQQSLTDGRPGSITISADNHGGVTLELQIQRSNDLVEWSSDPADLIQIPLTLSGDKEFFRFAIPE